MSVNVDRSGGEGVVVALCGGVGGAKLALGLYRILEPYALSVIINTGDDFEHLGLHISPDVDTVTYTLAGLSNTEAGWGRRDETWTFMKALKQLGGETWFSLGDGDLALHIERTRCLAAGTSLSAVTAEIANSFRIAGQLLPMTDGVVRTKLATAAGYLGFQDYFVRQQARPCVHKIVYEGASAALPAPGVIAALRQPNLRAIVICPSNPFLSIDPILALPGLGDALQASSAPVVCVSPLIAGQAVKGPTAKLMDELSVPRSVQAIARHYGALLDGMVIDLEDQAEASDIPVPVLVAPILMNSLEDRTELARNVLAFADGLRAGNGQAQALLRRQEHV